MKRLVFAALGMATVFLPMTAQAGEVYNREVHQEQRIYQGVTNHTISPQEYQNLQRREDALNVARYRDIHDGNGLQPWEKRQLNRRENNISHSIWVDRHN